ncbi:V-type immunoglobulin domain-containing suppressor of T-cell activation isoform X2 [Sebastes fasciatus]|uniref:V-type immunoglobulin domain-containing suppressor of T-cell activation isoform X2 n=1 Tax=Sebastes fasciatus TaxID=394691 RepID=UPI003D9DCAE0
MEWGLPRWSSLWGEKSMLWFCCVLFFIAGGKGDLSHAPSTLGVLAPHLYYTCPEGATVHLVCVQRGAALHSHDVLKRSWLFTPHSDQRCVGRTGPRNTIVGHSHGNRSLPPGLQYGTSEHNFWVALQNVTHADQGRYCCMVLDFQVEHQHGSLVQRPHSHVILQVTPRKDTKCMGVNGLSVASPGSVPEALAATIAACIGALLLLPIILVLVYKQRQNAQSSRRAQELVRMDSEALGHENPVFLGGSPQIKTRTVSQIMARQSSETGRHLLSEPGTPLSPAVHGDVFFPIEDTILESPDLVQV